MAVHSVALGQHGFKRIANQVIHHADLIETLKGNGGTSDGSNTYHKDVRKFTALLIMSADVAFDSGTEMANGSNTSAGSDAPDASDTFAQGMVIYGPFKKIQLSAGTVYAYYEG